VTDGSVRGWLAGDTDGLGGWPVTGGRGQSGCARALHGGWRCTEGVVDGLPLHRKLLRRRLGASTWGALVLITSANEDM